MMTKKEKWILKSGVNQLTAVLIAILLFILLWIILR